MPRSRLLLVLLLGVFPLPSFAATDTVPAAQFTITGTPGADEVTISDGPGRTTTVSSPSFESVTFKNKTNVVFDGLGGGDTVRFSNQYPPAGLASLIVKNVARIDQNARVRYPSLGLDATDSVEMPDPSNDVDRLEITAGHLITFVDADDVVIGGVSGSLAGLRTTGGIVTLRAVTGDITLSDTDAAEVISGGPVTLSAGRDLTIDVDRHAVVSSAGDTQLVASRDIVLGKNGHANDVRAGGPATLYAGRRLDVAGLTTVTGSVSDTSISALGLGAHVITQSDSARFVATGTAAELMVDAAGLFLRGNVPGLHSPLGSVLLVYPQELAIGAESGISALGQVRIWTYGIRLGTIGKFAGLPVELSDEELDRIETREIAITVHRNLLEVTGPITLDTDLYLGSEHAPTSSGSGHLEAPGLMISALQREPVRWTITPSTVRWDDSAPIPYSGVSRLSVLGGSGHDTFHVTPNATTRTHVYGYGPEPPETPGDTVTFELDGVADPVLQARLHPSGYGYEGTLSSSNRLPVQFWDIESFERAPVHLSVTNTDGVSRVAVGGRVTYTVTIHNHAPIPVEKAQVVDAVPPQLLDVRWTCVPSAGSGCTPSGSGDVRDAVTLAAGGSVTYSISGTAQESGILTNTVTVTAGDYVELDTADNTATDVTTVLAELPRKTRIVRRR